MNKTIKVLELGRKDYKETWDLQEELFQKVLDTKIKTSVKKAKSQQITALFL